MIIRTLLTLSLALLFAGCRVRKPVTTTNADGRIVTVIRIAPGQKLIEVGNNPANDHHRATIWVQTRNALDGEEFGSILHTEYDAEEGHVIRKVLLVEQPLPDAANKQSPMEEPVAPLESEPPVEITKKPGCTDKKVTSVHCEDIPWQ